MKYASLTVIALALLPAGVVAACASGSDSDLFDGGIGGNSATASTGGPASSASSGGLPDASGSCPAQCTTDLDCPAKCPGAPAGSLDCCDTATGICFVSADPVCPAPQPDSGGGGMPPY